MRATSQERATFGRRLAAALEARGWSQAQLKQHLETEHEISASRTAVSNWVNGRFAPDRPTTRAMDTALETGGALSAALGYTPPDDPGEEVVLPAQMKEWIESLDGEDQRMAGLMIQFVAARSSQRATHDILRLIGLGEMMGELEEILEEFPPDAARRVFDKGLELAHAAQGANPDDQTVEPRARPGSDPPEDQEP